METVRRSRASILPGQAALSRKLAKTDSVCVTLTRLRCWPEFAEVSVALYFRGGGYQPERAPLLMHRFDAEGSLRFGVLFGDGRYATNLDHLKWQQGAPRNPLADQPMLVMSGADGRPGCLEQWIILLPLPLPPARAADGHRGMAG
jgi:hypothetical protein